MLRLLNSRENWNALGANSITTAKSLLGQRFDLVLLGNGLSSLDEDSFTIYVAENYPETKVCIHYGGGSGLLFSEVRQTLCI
ncbi:hypothetical protein DYU05_06360 [Mucilaginibacter terrenus]|uniref:Uncharacterized protein n=2 Tax=Mucilaginibacter terrenus TaxID=2482727 RepID=A0A3E2NWC4_9SPHI|nr:hypothetical protein DYU05_06360 [Mucilaginibacter terrenus]